MKKKILLILSVLFLLTGCDNVYNLTIEDDILKEEIISIIPDDKADAVDKMFIEEDDFPFFDNYKHKYKKVVKKRNLGLTAKQKFAAQIFISVAFVFKKCISYTSFLKRLLEGTFTKMRK